MERWNSLNHEVLSQRLKEVATFVPEDSIVADIGTDHAYLPIYLVENQHISKAIGSEVVEGPFQNAERNVKLAGLEKMIDLRFGDGVETLSPADEIDVVTICGMGGKTIARILSTGYAKGILPVKRVILQPNTDSWSVRLWLVQHGYQIKAERLLEEGKGVYEIIVADYVGETIPLSRLDIRFGPFLRQEQSDLFKQKYQTDLDNLQRILTKVPTETPRYQYLKQQQSEIEEVLN